jgi:hypothetical protein
LGKTKRVLRYIVVVHFEKNQKQTPSYLLFLKKKWQRLLDTIRPLCKKKEKPRCQSFWPIGGGMVEINIKH